MEEQRAPSSSEALPIGSTKETDAGLVQALFPTLCFRPGGPAGLWEASRTLGSSYRTRNGPSWKEPHPGPNRGVRMNSLQKLGAASGVSMPAGQAWAPVHPSPPVSKSVLAFPNFRAQGLGELERGFWKGRAWPFLLQSLNYPGCPASHPAKATSQSQGGTQGGDGPGLSPSVSCSVFSSFHRTEGFGIMLPTVLRGSMSLRRDSS